MTTLLVLVLLAIAFWAGRLHEIRKDNCAGTQGRPGTCHHHGCCCHRRS